jgi:hypothetical protein
MPSIYVDIAGSSTEVDDAVGTAGTTKNGMMRRTLGWLLAGTLAVTGCSAPPARVSAARAPLTEVWR